jgi:hypothetical protein
MKWVVLWWITVTKINWLAGSNTLCWLTCTVFYHASSLLTSLQFIKLSSSRASYTIQQFTKLTSSLILRFIESFYSNCDWSSTRLLPPGIKFNETVIYPNWSSSSVLVRWFSFYLCYTGFLFWSDFVLVIYELQIMKSDWYKTFDWYFIDTQQWHFYII